MMGRIHFRCLGLDIYLPQPFGLDWDNPENGRAWLLAVLHLLQSQELVCKAEGLFEIADGDLGGSLPLSDWLMPEDGLGLAMATENRKKTRVIVLQI